MSLWPLLSGSTAAQIDAKSLLATRQHKAKQVIPRCHRAEAYSNSKLAVLAASIELEARLREAGAEAAAVTSNAVNPGPVQSGFYDKAPPPQEVRRFNPARFLAYIPPFSLIVWLVTAAQSLATGQVPLTIPNLTQNAALTYATTGR